MPESTARTGTTAANRARSEGRSIVSLKGWKSPVRERQECATANKRKAEMCIDQWVIAGKRSSRGQGREGERGGEGRGGERGLC